MSHETVPGCAACGRPTEYMGMVPVCRRNPNCEPHKAIRLLREEESRLRTASGRRFDRIVELETEIEDALARLAAAESRATAAEEALAYVNAVARGEVDEEPCKPDCNFNRFCGEPCSRHCSRRPVGLLLARIAELEAEARTREEALAGAVGALEHVEEQLALWEPTKYRAMGLVAYVRVALTAARRKQP